MRISDWSSDVCSSDLALLVTMSVHQRAVRRDRPKLEIQPATFVLTQQELLEQERLPRQRRRLVARQQGDRKSVVSGKRVSVRGDLGGSRIIQKKNTNNNVDK